MMFLWSWGGFLLGLITALMGQNMIMVCTAAVEKTVHTHLQEQLEFLDGRDDDLKNLIIKIQEQEEDHLSYAQQNVTGGFLPALIDKVVCIATEAVIFLSTWGDINRMKHDLAFYRGN